MIPGALIEIIIFIDKSFFRGSPIEPAGSSPDKPLHVRSAGTRTVHFKTASEKFLQDFKKHEERKFRNCLYSESRKHETTQDDTRHFSFSEQRNLFSDESEEMFSLLLSLLTASSADTSTAVRTRCIPWRDSGSGSLELQLAGARQLGGTPPSSCASLLLSDVESWVLDNLALTQTHVIGLSHLPSVSNARSVSNVIITIDRCRDPALTDVDSALWRRLFIAGCPRLQNNFSAPVTWIRDSNLLVDTPRLIIPGVRLGHNLSLRPPQTPTLLPAIPGGTRARATLASPASNSLRHCSGDSSYFDVIDGIVKTRLTNCSISNIYLYESPYLYLNIQVKLVKFHAGMQMY